MTDTISHLPLANTRWATVSYDFVSGDMHITVPETSGSIGGELWLNHAQVDALSTLMQNALQDVRCQMSNDEFFTRTYLKVKETS